MVITLLVEVLPNEVHFGLNSFILEVNCELSEGVYDSAFEYLMDYIVNKFEDKGLDIDIIPDDIYDFIRWVSSISNNFNDYIISYIETRAIDIPEEVTLTGLWDVFKGDIDEGAMEVIDEIIEVSKTLADFIEGLRDVFDARVRVVYDFYPEYDMRYFAQQIVEDVIEYNKRQEKRY